MTTHTDPIQHELTKAFLFLRTASTAVTNLQAQLKSANQSFAQHFAGYYQSYPATFEALLQDEGLEKQYLAVWEERWVEAGVGLIDWVATGKIGRGLPREILGMVEMELRRGEMQLPPLI